MPDMCHMSEVQGAARLHLISSVQKKHRICLPNPLCHQLSQGIAKLPVEHPIVPAQGLDVNKDFIIRPLGQHYTNCSIKRSVSCHFMGNEKGQLL